MADIKTGLNVGWLIGDHHCIKTFEDAKGVIRSRKSKKDRQYNGHKQ